jgi:hypothetical protein
MLEKEKNFIKFQCQKQHPQQGKNFQTESIIDTIKDVILSDNRTGWMYEVVGETILTWHRKIETLSCVLG